MAGFVALHHAMIRAAGRNQSEKIESMLAQGADPLFRNKEKKCALDLSIEGKSEACLSWLLPVSELSAENARGETPFLSAVRARWMAGAKMLLPHSDPRSLNGAGQSALMIATAAGDAELSRWLLPHSDLEHESAQATSALVNAVAHGWGVCHSDIVDALLAPLDASASSRQARLALEASERFSDEDNPEAIKRLGPLIDWDATENHARNSGRFLSRLGHSRKMRPNAIGALLALDYFQRPERQIEIKEAFAAAAERGAWPNADALGLGLADGDSAVAKALREGRGWLPRCAERFAVRERREIEKAFDSGSLADGCEQKNQRGSGRASRRI